MSMLMSFAVPSPAQPDVGKTGFNMDEHWFYIKAWLQ